MVTDGQGIAAVVVTAHQFHHPGIEAPLGQQTISSTSTQSSAQVGETMADCRLAFIPVFHRAGRGPRRMKRVMGIAWLPPPLQRLCMHYVLNS
jgi:hypothetical protein